MLALRGRSRSTARQYGGRSTPGTVARPCTWSAHSRSSTGWCWRSVPRRPSGASFRYCPACSMAWTCAVACLVSQDALAGRPEVATQVIGRGGDYLLALKGNQTKAHAEVKRWFEANAFSLGGSLRPCFNAFEDGHGRRVRRRVFTCTELEPLAAARR